MDNNETFQMTYSAEQQEEIQSIRQKYMPAEEDKMDQLRALDAGVTKKATAVSIAVGVIGTLILGIGMSLVMTDIGKLFGTLPAMVAGIAAGIAGILLICLAYPIYNRTLQKGREKAAPEILRLTDKLMK